MINIILLLVLGSGFAYASKFNSMLVTVYMGPYTVSSVPLFYVIVGSMLAGVIFAFLVQIIKNTTSFFELRSKSVEIKKLQDEVLLLTKRIHQLEIENERLKHAEPIEVDENAL